MIRFVTSADLQRRLFEIHAPSLDGKINWGKIAKMELNARAAKLNEAMLSLNDINLREHDRLCRTLSAIAAIAKNAANTPFMESQIKAARLWDRYWPDDFGMKKGAKTTANIAAWINTLAHDTSGDDDERQRADDIWNRLLVVAEKADNARNPYTFDLSEQIKFGDEMREGISSFQKEISAAMRGRLGLKHFPVMVQSSPRGRCIRFDVIMPQYPHDSTQTEEDQIFVGRDPNASGVSIDYYQARQFIVVSRLTDKATTREFAEQFARHVLGARLVEKNGLYYPLDDFSSRKYTATLRLSDDEAEHGGRVWVSALNCAYTDSKMQQTMIFERQKCEAQDIYEELNDIFTKDRFPYEAREVLRVEISFQLAERHASYGVPTGRFKTYRISFRPRSSDYHRILRKIPDEKHRETIRKVLASCDLLGKKLSQVLLPPISEKKEERK